MDLELIKTLVKPATTKIVMLVLDGLGGLPRESDGKTELEAAETPNLDGLAAKSVCGLQEPVGPGMTPGSGPGHLALFGYDPLRYLVGRGVLSALGVDFDLQPGDVAGRGNFCTVDDNGVVTDRRAGRIATEKNKELCELLREIELPGIELFVQTVKEHRFLFVLRGKNLSGAIGDTDPQETGKKPLEPAPQKKGAEQTAELVNQFVTKARKKLREHHPANMVLLRGFDQRPDWPMVTDIFGVRAAAIAAYPMYRGVSRLLGMDLLTDQDDLPTQLDALKQAWDDYDFFYLHVKKIDSHGEDGDFEKKKSLIEEVDRQLPGMLDLQPDVVVVTGDHSTPATMKYHSWHPVPVLVYSKHCRPDPVHHFGETQCLRGGLGPYFPGKNLMPLALANADRLNKFGA